MRFRGKTAETLPPRISPPFRISLRTCGRGPRGEESGLPELLSCGHLDSQRLHCYFIRRGLPIFLRHYTEVAGVVPHGPAHAMVLQCGSHVGNPTGAVLRIGIRTMYT